MRETQNLCKRIAAAAGAALMMLHGAALPANAEDNAEKLRVMCFGDSITDGFWLPGGYRNTLCSLISEHGQEDAIDFVGNNWGGSGYDPQHAGYSGFSVDDIAQQDSISGARTGISGFAQSLLDTCQPDVVFLQIGTNDILSLYALDTFGERLEHLVDTVLASLPENGCLYLATLPVMDANDHLYISEYFFTVESMDEAVESCNKQIKALAEKKRGEGKHLILADINGLLTKADLYDGVHPSEAGYAKMGQFWYERLEEYRSGKADIPGSAEQPPEQQQRGDLNGDGQTDSADTVILKTWLGGSAEALTAEQGEIADLDANDSINAVDLTLLKRIQTIHK